MAEIISLSQPTLQLRQKNIEDKKLFSELQTLVRDIEKHFIAMALAVNNLDDQVGVDGYNDYLVSGLALGKSASAPNMTLFRDSIYLNAFQGNPGVTEQGYFSLHILHDFKANTVPTFHIHWSHNAVVSSGDVKWQVEYSVIRGYSTNQYPASRTVSSIQTAGAQYTHHITPDDDMPLLSGDDLEVDAVIIGRVFRDSADAADTFANDAFLIQIDMHYQIGQLTTNERNTFLDEGFDS